ncbi:MAG: hypothetical protein II630_04475 [Bacteroidales bacterium]|nr:hypothetical protein [Bacteroidales bacterium]
MARRKYQLYLLTANYGEVQEQYWEYQDAFRRYHIVEGPATLYGVNEQGDISVIMSRA